MREIKMTPNVCKGDGAKFKGSVTLKQPSNQERWKFYEDCGLEIGDDGAKITTSNFSVMRKMVDLSKGHYLKVEISKVADSLEYKSFDDLDSDPDAESIMIEIGMGLLRGFRPGNE